MANIGATIRRQGRRAAGAAALVACVAAGSLSLSAAEELDRVLAVVSGTVIMMSDARIATAFGAVDTTGAPDPVAVTLRWLVDRQLVLDEVSRYNTVEMDQTRVADGLARVRARFPSDEAYARALDRLGLDERSARRWIEETTRMQDYLGRRFDTMFPPTEEELLDYYTRNAARFNRNGVQQPFDEAREDVREILQQERQRQAVETWLTRLRRRANVNEVYVPIR